MTDYLGDLTSETGLHGAPVTPFAPENPSYGSKAELVALLDCVTQTLTEEAQENWGDLDVQEASRALRDHLSWRVDR